MQNFAVKLMVCELRFHVLFARFVKFGQKKKICLIIAIRSETKKKNTNLARHICSKSIEDCSFRLFFSQFHALAQPSNALFCARYSTDITYNRKISNAMCCNGFFFTYWTKKSSFHRIRKKKKNKASKHPSRIYQSNETNNLSSEMHQWFGTKHFGIRRSLIRFNNSVI